MSPSEDRPRYNIEELDFSDLLNLETILVDAIDKRETANKKALGRSSRSSVYNRRADEIVSLGTILGKVRQRHKEHSEKVSASIQGMK